MKLRSPIAVALVLGVCLTVQRSEAEPPPHAAHPQPLDRPAVLVAPDLASWRAELSEATARGDSTLALAAGTLAEQNAFAARRGGCDDDLRGQAALRAERLGRAWRDELQGLRSVLDRLERTATSPTIAPILGDRDRARLGALARLSREQTASYLHSVARQDGGPKDWLARCGVPDLAPHLGANPDVVAPSLVPIVVAAPGVLHPLEARVEPGVVLLRGEDAVACLMSTDRAPDADPCAPLPLRPGAVLVPSA